METEKELTRQTEKMLKDIKVKREGMRLIDKGKENLVKNLDAYISDTRHFLGKKDLIRAFEAVVYAWGILETLERAGIIDFRNQRF